MPYTFQLLAQLLEFHSPGNVGDTYTILYPFLLTPVLWEKTSNIHPLVRLLRSYVRKTSPENFEKSLNIVSVKNFVFRKLLIYKKKILEWTFRRVSKTYCIKITGSRRIQITENNNRALSYVS